MAGLCERMYMYTCLEDKMRAGTDKSSGEGQGWMEHTEAVQAEVEQQDALLVMTPECLQPELSGG